MKKTLASFSCPDSFFDVIVSHKLTKAELSLYLLLIKHIQREDGGEIHLTYEEMGRTTGLSYSSVKNGMQSLKDKSLVTITKQGEYFERNYTYKITFPHPSGNGVFSLLGKTYIGENLPHTNNGQKLPDVKLLLLIRDSGKGDLQSPSPHPSNLDPCPSASGREKEKKDFVVAENDDDVKSTTKTTKKQRKSSLIEQYTEHPLLDKTKKEPTKYLLSAHRLRDALSAHKVVVKSTPQNMGKWAVSLEEFDRDNENITWDEIEDNLNWYCNNLGTDDFLPQIECVTSFRSKYNTLVNNRKRIERQRANQSSDPEAYIASQPNPYVKETTPEEQQFKRDAMAHWL